MKTHVGQIQGHFVVGVRRIVFREVRERQLDPLQSSDTSCSYAGSVVCSRYLFFSSDLLGTSIFFYFPKNQVEYEIYVGFVNLSNWLFWIK